jgi:hypothetical protein
MRSYTTPKQECPNVIHHFVIELRGLIDGEDKKLNKDSFLKNFYSLETSELFTVFLTLEGEDETALKRYDFRSCRICFDRMAHQIYPKKFETMPLVFPKTPKDMIVVLFSETCKGIEEKWQEKVKEIIKMYFSKEEEGEKEKLSKHIIEEFIEGNYKPFIEDSMDGVWDEESAVDSDIIHEFLWDQWNNFLDSMVEKKSFLLGDIANAYYTLFRFPVK